MTTFRTDVSNKGGVGLIPIKVDEYALKPFQSQGALNAVKRLANQVQIDGKINKESVLYKWDTSGINVGTVPEIGYLPISTGDVTKETVKPIKAGTSVWRSNEYVEKYLNELEEHPFTEAIIEAFASNLEVGLLGVSGGVASAVVSDGSVIDAQIVPRAISLGNVVALGADNDNLRKAVSKAIGEIRQEGGIADTLITGADAEQWVRDARSQNDNTNAVLNDSQNPLYLPVDVSDKLATVTEIPGETVADQIVAVVLQTRNNVFSQISDTIDMEVHSERTVPVYDVNNALVDIRSTSQGQKVMEYLTYHQAWAKDLSRVRVITRVGGGVV